MFFEGGCGGGGGEGGRGGSGDRGLKEVFRLVNAKGSLSHFLSLPKRNCSLSLLCLFERRDTKRKQSRFALRGRVNRWRLCPTNSPRSA